MLSKEFLTGITAGDIQRILQIEHSDPHSVFGAHPARIKGQDGLISRFFHPTDFHRTHNRERNFPLKRNRVRWALLDMAT